MPLRLGERPEGQVPLENPWIFGGPLTPRGRPLEEDLVRKGTKEPRPGRALPLMGREISNRHLDEFDCFEDSDDFLNQFPRLIHCIVVFLPPLSKGDAGRSDLVGTWKWLAPLKSNSNRQSPPSLLPG
jgi:hypothetical protein